jgi:amino acid transporter
MWAVSDHVPAQRVFTEFQDGGGWGNMGLSVLVGISSPIFFFVGPDAGVHMSEELKGTSSSPWAAQRTPLTIRTDASIILPRAMMFSIIFNGALGVVMLITFVFCIPNINAVIVLNQPILQVIYNISGSYSAACILGSLLLVLIAAATITNIATASRQAWAFARDRGFPYSSWIMKVDPRKNLPVNALYMCAIVSAVLAVINFGSDVAFNALVSISNAALTFSYIISISCIRLKRWRGEPLLNCRWSLGRLGAPINDISLAFLLLAFVMSFFPILPLTQDPRWAADMNWACLMFVVAVVLALGYYMISGHRIYVPPVRLVKQQ